jgi:hypothetical protein
VGVSDADKERMRRLAVHFRDAETDEEPDPDVRRLASMLPTGGASPTA